MGKTIRNSEDQPDKKNQQIKLVKKETSKKRTKLRNQEEDEY